MKLINLINFIFLKKYFKKDKFNKIKKLEPTRVIFKMIEKFHRKQIKKARMNLVNLG